MNQELKKELPPKYYLDNFNSVLSFVERMYGAFLSPEEQSFIDHFRKLSEDARCLFLRFANRRGLFFRTDRLQYPELKDIQASLDELMFHQFVELPAARHQSLASRFLCIFGKAELIQLYKNLRPGVKGLSKYKKPELVQQLVEEFSWKAILEAVSPLGPVIKHNYEQELAFLKFLFFGHLGGDMSEFVIRDLGVVRHETPDEDHLVALFSSRKEMEDKFAVSVGYEHFRELREQNCPESLYAWYMEWSSAHPGWSAPAEPLFNRLTLKLARILERHKQPYWALEIYEQTQMAPSRERRVRLLQKTGAMQEALELCHQMEQAPQNADELFFARDFQGILLKKKRNKSTTLHLKEAEAVQISLDYRYQVEKGVIHYYIDQGQEAMYSENFFWRSLFGLVFWDIMYDTEVPVFHSPFQRAPSDLYLPHFLLQRREQLEGRMDSFKNSQELLQYLERTYDEKWGMGNPLVNWHENTMPLLRAGCEKIPPSQLKVVLLEMAKNLKENGRGFPDLFCWDKNSYAFVEVKSPNDTLSAQQLYWLQFFDDCGITAKVLRVEWGEVEIKN